MAPALPHVSSAIVSSTICAVYTNSSIDDLRVRVVNAEKLFYIVLGVGGCGTVVGSEQRT